VIGFIKKTRISHGKVMWPPLLLSSEDQNHFKIKMMGRNSRAVSVMTSGATTDCTSHSQILSTISSCVCVCQSVKVSHECVSVLYIPDMHDPRCSRCRPSLAVSVTPTKSRDDTHVHAFKRRRGGPCCASGFRCAPLFSYQSCPPPLPHSPNGSKN